MTTISGLARKLYVSICTIYDLACRAFSHTRSGTGSGGGSSGASGGVMRGRRIPTDANELQFWCRYFEFDEREWDLSRFARALRFHLITEFRVPSMLPEPVFLQMFTAAMDHHTISVPVPVPTTATATTTTVTTASATTAVPTRRMTDEHWDAFTARYGPITESYKAVKAVCQR